ncbi:MAG: hypothetical protein LWW85_05175, partial [Marinilabiliales bacterium]|nr:hypothetical protein [Marinilabiliales bacterium]
LPEAMERGLKALSLHAVSIQKYNASTVRLIGTSAIRSAANKVEFIEKVRSQFGWELEVIDGDKEAGYIFRGTVKSLPPIDDPYLVLDIGGGSNEFILAKGDQILWKKSFNIGIARVLELFSLSDPPTLPEIARVETWFSEHLDELFIRWQECPAKTLVGCSGAFDTLMDIREGKEPDATFRISSDFPLETFHALRSRLMAVGYEERSRIQGVDSNRVAMIVIAVMFINFILHKLNIERMIHTHFSLKEGVMFEMSEQYDKTSPC